MVILLGLIFLLDRSTHDQTMKISFIFFRALFHLICIYKVQANFWNCLNRLEKGFLLPGHMLHPESTRGWSPGVGSRGTWHTRRVPGGGLPVWARGARGAPGECPEGGLPMQ